MIKWTPEETGLLLVIVSPVVVATACVLSSVFAGPLPRIVGVAKADDGVVTDRPDRWFDTYNAAMTGCLSRVKYVDDCCAEATQAANRTHGRMP